MSFLLFGHFVCTQFTAFCAAKQARTQKGKHPVVFAGDEPVSAGCVPFQLFSKILYTAYHLAALPRNKHSALQL
jgi:hypothetical protein